MELSWFEILPVYPHYEDSLTRLTRLLDPRSLKGKRIFPTGLTRGRNVAQYAVSLGTGTGGVKIHQYKSLALI